MSNFKFSTASQSRLDTVDFSLQRVVHRALSMSSIDFGIPPYGGTRPAEVQYELYAEGKSKADGYSRISKHQEGRAVDLYAFVDGKASWDQAHLAVIATYMLAAANELGIKIEWGGHWIEEDGDTYGWDAGHYELVG